MATKLQFDPDYYRIVNLEEEESKDEKEVKENFTP